MPSIGGKYGTSSRYLRMDGGKWETRLGTIRAKVTFSGSFLTPESKVVLAGHFILASSVDSIGKSRFMIR